jgi:cell division protein FtsZ
LATGLENELRSDLHQDIHRNEDDYYEDLIPQLYKPAKVETMGKVIAKEQELEFKVEEAQEPEPAVAPEPVDHGDGSGDPSSTVNFDHENRPHDPEPVEEPKQQTIVEKWKGWLNSLIKDVIE